MIDLILLVFMLITFAIGFWLGSKYGTVKAMGRAFMKWVDGLWT